MRNVILELRKTSEARTVTDWLKNLLNRTNIPVVLMGLQRSEDVLELNEQLRRRFSSRFSLKPFGFKTDDEITSFRGLLGTIQDQLPMESCSLRDQSTAERFYYATGGLIDYIAKIVDAAVQHAALAGQKYLDHGSYATAFNLAVWKDCPDDLNPFLNGTKLRPLTKKDQPFSFMTEWK